MEIKTSLKLGLILCVGVFTNTFAENTATELWQDEVTKPAKTTYQQARYLTLDSQNMLDKLKPIPSNAKAYKSTRKTSSKPPRNKINIDLPLPSGELISVTVIEDSILPASLQAKYPQILTFKILPDAFVVSGSLDSTPNGFHGMLQTRDGETIFIDPVSKEINKQITYASYKKSAQHFDDKHLPFSCSVAMEHELAEKSSRSTASKSRDPKDLINYRIAIAATGEYTAKHGGTVASALSAITTTLNRVNQVYEQDLGIHLSLVDNNDLLIYTNASSDPYDAGANRDKFVLLAQNQANINAVIGSANYDVGHLFSTSGGGLAAIASVCSNNRKAQGVSGTNYVNDSFALDFVAHEIGHQFGATHSFNGTEGLCAGNTRTAITAFEPGSGSSIMSYAGYCGRDNLQTNSDAMFHIGSIQQIRNYVTRKLGNNCGIQSTANNTPPQVNAGKNYTIPAQTPFELQGSATDIDNDQLVYTWEQVDAGSASPESLDRGNNALFRIHMPSQSKKRSFPPVSDIVNHVANRGEHLPTQQRLMKFKFVVQDSYNITQSDEMSVSVQRTGSRFSLNLPRSQYTLGDTYKILWNVAGTDRAPINCESVDIALSVNGGYQFSYSLGENIPNTGEAWVTIPSTIASTNRGRFKLSCSDNVFFALSYRDFKLNHQDHESRIVLADEDKSEPDIFNKWTDKQSQVKKVEQARGGSVGGYFLFLMLLGLISIKLKRL